MKTDTKVFSNDEVSFYFFVFLSWRITFSKRYTPKVLVICVNCLFSVWCLWWHGRTPKFRRPWWWRGIHARFRKFGLSRVDVSHVLHLQSFKNSFSFKNGGWNFLFECRDVDDRGYQTVDMDKWNDLQRDYRKGFKHDLDQDQVQ